MRMQIVKKHANIRICECEYSDHHYTVIYLSDGSILRSCLQPSRSSKSLPSSTSQAIVPLLFFLAPHQLLPSISYVIIPQFSFLPAANPDIFVAIFPHSSSSHVHTLWACFFQYHPRVVGFPTFSLGWHSWYDLFWSPHVSVSVPSSQLPGFLISFFVVRDHVSAPCNRIGFSTVLCIAILLSLAVNLFFRIGYIMLMLLLYLLIRLFEIVSWIFWEFTSTRKKVYCVTWFTLWSPILISKFSICIVDPSMDPLYFEDPLQYLIPSSHHQHRQRFLLVSLQVLFATNTLYFRIYCCSGGLTFF